MYNMVGDVARTSIQNTMHFCTSLYRSVYPASRYSLLLPRLATNITCISNPSRSNIESVDSDRGAYLKMVG